MVMCISDSQENTNSKVKCDQQERYTSKKEKIVSTNQ